MSQAKWTLMVYMAGDNDLEQAGWGDLGEMAQIGSTEEVNVVVQFDTLKDEKTYRYFVAKGKLEKVGELGEINTGKPENLTDFIRWAMREYPAGHYLLSIWNHGTGWVSIPKDYDWDLIGTLPEDGHVRRAIFASTVARVAGRNETERAICLDRRSEDALDNRELKKALSDVGRKLDIIGFDACLMNMIEVAYQIREAAYFMVGSEEEEPGAGWPYHLVLETLTTDPDIAPEKLARRIAQHFKASYPGQGAITQSALDIRKVGDVKRAVDRLALAMMEHLPSDAAFIKSILKDTQKFAYPHYVDLADFANRLRGQSPRDDVRQAADALVDALLPEGEWGFVLAYERAEAMTGAYGVAIYFPEDGEVTKDYQRLDFISDGGQWDRFLRAYRDGIKRLS